MAPSKLMVANAGWFSLAGKMVFPLEYNTHAKERNSIHPQQSGLFTVRLDKQRYVIRLTIH